MVSETITGSANEPNTKVIYVGAPRYKALTAVAIEVSHKTGRLISPSQVSHYLIDHHLNLVQNMMIRHLTGGSDEPSKQS